MTSEKQIAANRANARRSTGPKTEAGKEIAKLNAVKHGALSPLPVLPALETPNAWEVHLAGTLASLAPVGHLETVLAERVAKASSRRRSTATVPRSSTSKQRRTKSRGTWTTCGASACSPARRPSS